MMYIMYCVIDMDRHGVYVLPRRGEDGDYEPSSIGSYILDDSATTVWSSATLPNMSGSSLITAAMQPDTIDTVDPQSTAKTQQSVSTIDSR